jgi:hypothetical protein
MSLRAAKGRKLRAHQSETVGELIRLFTLWFPVARAIAEHWPEFEVTSFEKRDTRTQMVIVNGFTDVELIRLGPV